MENPKVKERYKKVRFKKWSSLQHATACLRMEKDQLIQHVVPQTKISLYTTNMHAADLAVSRILETSTQNSALIVCFKH